MQEDVVRGQRDKEREKLEKSEQRNEETAEGEQSADIPDDDFKLCVAERFS